MRFITPGDTHGSSSLPYGDTVCFRGDALVSFSSRSIGQRNQRYDEYIRLGSGADEWIWSSSRFTYDSSTPCANFTTYSVDSLPTSLEFSSQIITCALLDITLIISVVWAVIRPIFPRHLRFRGRD
ncbi:hypothetical protein ACUXZ5_04160 [Alloscardovia omnicolens]|uniref:hypothetical protein n=1 Tax=Alloscardovia omnicolens TaxID=419015 RepID=UPI00405571F3